MATTPLARSSIDSSEQPVRRAAIYCRISKDDEKAGKGVARQLADARTLAAQRGFEIVGEYEDNDISAYRGVLRPGYEAMMRQAQAGRLDVVVCYMTSRLWRKRSQRAAEIDRLGKLRVSVVAVRGPELDLATASGRLLADVLGSMDSNESELMSERISRAALDRVVNERLPHSHLGYGWDRNAKDLQGRPVQKEPEAAIIRELVDRLLAGETLRSLVLSLNERDLPAPRGGTWLPTIVRQVVLRPTVAGRLIYKGEDMGDGNWPAIVERDKHDRLLALLQAPERLTHRPGKRKHLLTYADFANCGVCGGRLSARLERNRADGHWVYRCDSRSCVSRDQVKVDALVTAVVTERLSRPDAATIFDNDESASKEARGRAETIRARLDLAADAFAVGDIDGPQLKRITSSLRPKLAEAEEDARQHYLPALPANVDDLLGARATATWGELPVIAKRAVIEVLGLRVIIQPTKRSVPGLEATSIELRWGTLGSK